MFSLKYFPLICEQRCVFLSSRASFKPAQSTERENKTQDLFYVRLMCMGTIRLNWSPISERICVHACICVPDSICLLYIVYFSLCIFKCMCALCKNVRGKEMEMIQWLVWHWSTEKKEEKKVLYHEWSTQCWGSCFESIVLQLLHTGRSWSTAKLSYGEI